MSAGERGPTGDHGQSGDQGLSGIQGERGYVGAEGQAGAAGERGQSGDTGQVGPAGPKGEKGDRYSSWLTRNVVKGYAFLLVGVLVSIALSAVTAERNAERMKETMMRFEQETIANDRAFCALVNRTYAEINKNRDASRKAYNLLVTPNTPPDSPIVKFRDDLLRTIDGNLPQLDCSGIGSVHGERFSVQDAIRNHTIPTPTTRP